MGSITPWIEATLLSENDEVTTVDYNPVRSEHPAIRSLPRRDFLQMHDHFDAIVS